MTVAELITKLQTLDPKLPVWAYNESGYMREVKHKPIHVQLKRTSRYEPVSLILINPDKL